MKQQLKHIADNIRLLIVLQLADWIIKITPSNPKGDAWVLAIYGVLNQDRSGEKS